MRHPKWMYLRGLSESALGTDFRVISAQKSLRSPLCGLIGWIRISVQIMGASTDTARTERTGVPRS